MCLWRRLALDKGVAAEPVVVDYVHIRPGAALVAVGSRVRAGQPICLSGNVGFSPEPHVHLEVHPAAVPMGPSLPLEFDCVGAGVFTPRAGRWYTEAGEAPAPGGGGAAAGAPS